MPAATASVPSTRVLPGDEAAVRVGAAWLSLAPPVSTMPEPFEKIELDRIEFPLAVGPFTFTPAPVLKAITLPAPEVVPPIVLSADWSRLIPSSPFGIFAVPSKFVPTKLPSTIS